MATPDPADVPFFQVDAFTDRPFAGNPAAVCLLPAGEWPDETWMQRVAAEMNLSETAFVRPEPVEKQTPPTFDLRWFTPTVEVELCGHATLASAHVLFTREVVSGDEVCFSTLHAGVLPCVRHGDGRIAMDFPAHHGEPCPAPGGVYAALGVRASRVRQTHFGPYDLLVELDTPGTVAGLNPDTAALSSIEARGIAVTAAVPETDRADFHHADFVSRFFAPRAGIPEDPVTGSLHCLLGPYWAQRFGKDELTAFQCSPRGGILGVHIRGGRVELLGHAVTVLYGFLNKPQNGV